jgi:acyl-CoA reductase-like NAD-dependent aldehyde dehydrogenase
MPEMPAGVSQRSFNPSSGVARAARPYLNDESISQALAHTAAAGSEWRAASFPERAAVLVKVAQLLRQRRAGLAQTITLEMGKPLAEAEAEIDKSA